jgi:type I restriction enzyme M protein
MANVSNLVKTIQDIMRKDAGTYGDAQRLEQLGWMFFLKIFDDREKEMELLRDGYKSPLLEHLRWSNWATDEEGITGDALLDFVNNTLLPKLKALPGGQDKIAGLIRMTFEDANNYMKNGTLMRQVINKINGIDFNASDDRHMFGDIYEKLLKDLQSAGNAGEFYTPRAVTQFIVDQIDPRLDKRETILDPACGTGGFLTSVIEHLRKQAKTADDEAYIQNCFAGIEKKHLPHVLCMTNLLLHGIDVPSSVRHDNTLARPLRDWSPKERVDVIVTNPPFGGMEEDGIEANFPTEFRTRETSDLFLVLLMKVLKPGGRAGLVLPDGTLFGEGVKTRIKEALLTDCNLHTIVRLPNGVFSPYTGIRTNLLFFTKGQPTTEIWYYEHPYPQGAKSYNKGKPIRIEEFEPEKKWWKRRVENQHAWRVSIEQIREGNYNLDLKNPHTSGAEPSDVFNLLPQYESLLTKIAETRALLKQEMNRAVAENGGVDLDLLFHESYSIPPADLRKIILNLAVQGKLVPQDPTDEPVADLLERVERERSEVRARTYVPMTPSDAPFYIPGSWAWVRLGNIALGSDSGWSPQCESQAREGDAWGVLKVSAVSWGKFLPEENKALPSGLSAREECEVKVGDFLLSRANTEDLVARSVVVVDTPPHLMMSDKIVRFAFPEMIDKVFINLVNSANFARAYYSRNASGTSSSMKNVGREVMSNLPVPLPPLAEQRRIVAQTNALFALVDQMEKMITTSRSVAGGLVDAIVSEFVTEGAK